MNVSGFSRVFLAVLDGFFKAVNFGVVIESFDIIIIFIVSLFFCI